MLRGYRGIFIAVAGLALLGANPVSQNARGNAAAAQSDKSADKKKDVASGISRIGEALKAQNAKADPYEKQRNEREIRDLQAQENSAYWAEMMFWATVSALVLSFVGIGLVWTTFRETRKANDIAKNAQRPYLYIDKIRPAELSKFTKHLVLDIKNFGATPATQIKVGMTARRCLNSAVVAPKCFGGQWIACDDIPQGKVLPTEAALEFEHWPEFMAAHAKGESVLVCSIWIEYAGVDGVAVDYPLRSTIIYGVNGPRMPHPSDNLQYE
jgi:hypothetical protein